MTDEERSRCHKIIHTAAAAAGAIGGGLAQLPGSDTVPITAIQVGMIVGLGAVFGKTITKTAATSIVSGFIASYGGRALSQWLVGWIPGWGNAVNASTAVGITEAMGWAVAEGFSEGDNKEGENEDAED